MSFEPASILLWMALILFGLGVLSFIAGLLILVTRTTPQEIRTLATQTNHLAQKGLLDGVAGLVGNASTLLDALNQLVRTVTGIGVFLVCMGILLIGTSLFILMQTLA